jgi:hypothetical protein
MKESSAPAHSTHTRAHEQRCTSYISYLYTSPHGFHLGAEAAYSLARGDSVSTARNTKENKKTHYSFPSSRVLFGVGCVCAMAPDKGERMERWRLARTHRLSNNDEAAEESPATPEGRPSSSHSQNHNNSSSSSNGATTATTANAGIGGGIGGGAPSTTTSPYDLFRDPSSPPSVAALDLAEPNIPWAMEDDEGVEDDALMDDTNWLGGTTTSTTSAASLTTPTSAAAAAAAASTPPHAAVRRGGTDRNSFSLGTGRTPTRSGGGGNNPNNSATKGLPPRPSTPTNTTTATTTAAAAARSANAGRVRVGVRLRPLTRQEKASWDPEEIPVVEASPETNRILLRRNQWDGESYQFDQAYPAHTSQKRIYEMAGGCTRCIQ